MDERTDTSDHALDGALAALPPPQLDALTRRTQLQRAQALLRAGRTPAGSSYEPPVLVALAAMQLVWLVVRVLGS